MSTCNNLKCWCKHREALEDIFRNRPEVYADMLTTLDFMQSINLGKYSLELSEELVTIPEKEL